ncbi:YolD-like family protein [Paenibacillus sp. N3/727]|uniref:YolD-like family protein n=1 Tax=Paenibacillus sp. N3/727 TaxID=2925845 RepID=UPI001F52CD42|nr:YolD-like family protein [Paenibacillus sp. N3/727]UNK20462.1 YolD-like family protein [Paenibacillus sp. N3/727]
MSKKLEDNGLWESSRMMLPQHKERIVEHNKHLTKREKPILHDDDEWEMVIQNVNLSLNYTNAVVVEVFGEYENRCVEGVITSVSMYAKKMKVESDQGFEWIDFDELVSVKLVCGGINNETIRRRVDSY